MAFLRGFVALSLILLVSLQQSTEGFRVLGLFPHPGISHFHFFHPIMRALAEAGHEVTVVSHFPDKSPPNHYKDLVIGGLQTLNDSIDLKMFGKRPFFQPFVEFFLLHEWGRDSCETALKSQAIATVLKMGKSQKYFDVILMEQFNTDCLLGVAHLLKAPVISLSSCALLPWHYDRVGAPQIPSYMPSLATGYSEHMTFFQRLWNWVMIHSMKLLYRQYSDSTANELLRRRYGNELPDVADLAKETSLFFVNQHYSLSGAKPLSPAVIELGGVHIQKAKALDVDLQKLLDNAKNGAIYISWGSMIRAESLPDEKRNAIVKALGRLKQTVLWKWENDTLPNRPSNVHISKWLPQRDILCHPNVKVFLSHTGMLGSSEAAYCGVPVVATPMYGDQFLNAAALINRGMGVLLPYDDIIENNVFKAIKKALEPIQLEHAKAVSYSFKNRPKKAIETALWWVEHVAKTEGAPFTKSPSTYMSAFQYYSLDVHLFFIVIITFSVGSWVWLISVIRNSRRTVVQKTKQH